MVNAKEVKQVLKENGIDTKKISVRCLSAGYEQVIRVTLKDIYLPLGKITAIVNDNFKNIDYDEYTMEILAGGNTFVEVEYDEDIYEEAVKSKQKEAEAKLKELENQPSDYGYELASKDNLVLYGNKATNQIIITDKTNSTKRHWYNINKYDMARALLALETA